MKWPLGALRQPPRVWDHPVFPFYGPYPYQDSNSMSFVNNVRIVSDGTATGTKVLTPDGRELACKAIRFSHNADEVPIVTLELIGVQLEVDMLHIDTLRKTKGGE